MTRIFLSFFLTAVLVGGSSAEEKPLSIDDLNRIEITGRLGVPLHTVHLIEARVVDMSFTRAKADDGRVGLKIVSVGGNAREGDHYVDLPRDLEASKPSLGTVFRFWGYETIATAGFPTEAFRKLGEPPFATVGLHFRPRLVVLKRLEADASE